MKLMDYLYETGENVSEFAARADLERHTVNSFIIGRKCSIKTIHKIRVATAGKVTEKDLIE